MISEYAQPNFVQRIHNAWPEARPEDCLIIHPIGSRHDALIYWRVKGRVTTGSIGTDRPCFEGDLDKFAESVERRYTNAPHWRHYHQDYRAAIQFLQALGPLNLETAS